MIVFFGTRLYGKVDHVPGLFYVGTNFFYIQFVPLFPTGSVLMLDDGSERGISLGLNGKSVLFTYLRAVSLLGGIAAAAIGIISLAESLLGGAILMAVGVGLIVLFILSYKLARPSPDRAVRLAVQAGIPPEVVAQYFVDFQFNPDDYPQPEVQEVEEVLPADDDDPPRRRRRRRRDDDYDDDDRYLRPSRN